MGIPDEWTLTCLIHHAFLCPDLPRGSGQRWTIVQLTSLVVSYGNSRLGVNSTPN